MTHKVWAGTYSSLIPIHQKMKDDVEQEFLDSQADILVELDNLLKNLHRLVLQQKSTSPEFHIMVDHFLERAMTISDPALTVRYVRLAINEWNLPISPEMQSFNLFHQRYGKYIRGLDEPVKTQMIETAHSTVETNTKSKWITWALIAGLFLFVFFKG